MNDSTGTASVRVTVDLSESDLISRMHNFEDHFVERKTVKDDRDWKKTAVAFANSAPIGVPAVLYIGVKDNGEIETPQANLDEVQKKFDVRLQRVYPPIGRVSKIVAENGRQALAIIIPGSVLRPHFAGLSYVRQGCKSVPASDDQFAELIAQRNSKANRILAWKGKAVTVISKTEGSYGPGGESQWPERTVLRYCDQFYLTLQLNDTAPSSFPLDRVTINFDNSTNRLQLIVVR